MQQLKNLSEINTNTIEGRLLIAAMAKISKESQTDKQPDEILGQCHELAEKIYKYAGPLPSSEPVKMCDFQTALRREINKRSIESDSDTPDFILAKYLDACLENYNAAVVARDKWFGVDMWDGVKPSKKNKQSNDFPEFEKILKETPLNIRLSVSNYMAFVSLITELGYRDDKAWGEDENELHDKLTMCAQQHTIHQLDDIKGWINDGKPLQVPYPNPTNTTS